MTVRMKLTVAYLGTPFEGWQRQPGRSTVQGELERAIAAVIRRPGTAVTGAGRTDAGVHAAGQVAHVDLPAPIPPDDLQRALNRRLPGTIRVRAVRPVVDNFHARYDAVGKRYVYRLRLRPPALPWAGLRTATIPDALHPGRLRRAVDLFPGTRDWASFSVPDQGPGGTVRTVHAVTVRPIRGGFNLSFEGDGFLRYQIRRMTGAALEVAAGSRLIEELERLLSAPVPGAPVRTAPAVGLSLEAVRYRRR